MERKITSTGVMILKCNKHESDFFFLKFSTLTDCHCKVTIVIVVIIIIIVVVIVVVVVVVIITIIIVMTIMNNIVTSLSTYDDFSGILKLCSPGSLSLMKYKEELNWHWDVMHSSSSWKVVLSFRPTVTTWKGHGVSPVIIIITNIDRRRTMSFIYLFNWEHLHGTHSQDNSIMHRLTWPSGKLTWTVGSAEVLEASDCFQLLVALELLPSNTTFSLPALQRIQMSQSARAYS